MKKNRVGIVGCGNIFPMHAYSLEKIDNVELVAVCDVKEDRADRWASKFEVDAFYDYEKMILEANLDTVHICTPHHLHANMMEIALRNNIDVICEKPATLSYEDYKRVMLAKEESNKQVAISFQNRFNPSSEKIKYEIESGKLGKIKAGRAYLAWNRSDEYYGKSDWKGTWDKEGGGVLIDQAIHTLDLMTWFINKPVTDININMGRRGHSKIDVDDFVEGVITFEGNIMTSVHFVNHYVIDAPIEVEIIFEKAIIRMVGDVATIDYLDGNILTIERDPNVNFDLDGVKQYWGVGHKSFIEYCYKKLQNGEKIERNTLEDVHLTHKLVFDMYKQGRDNFQIR